MERFCGIFHIDHETHIRPRAARGSEGRANRNTFFRYKAVYAHRKAVAKIDTYPLNEANLVIQQDAYKRLASLDDLFEDDLFESFATINCSRKEKDTSLRFAVDFSAVGFTLFIEALEPLFFEYAFVFDNEKQGADQIMQCLTMLANGQIACLVTERHGRFCANELLAYERHETHPTIIATDGAFGRTWREKDETGNTSVNNTPEPYTTTAILAYLGLPFAAIFLAFRMSASITSKERTWSHK